MLSVGLSFFSRFVTIFGKRYGSFSPKILALMIGQLNINIFLRLALVEKATPYGRIVIGIGKIMVLIVDVNSNVFRTHVGK